jgi:hypothetical protein
MNVETWRLWKMTLNGTSLTHEDKMEIVAEIGARPKLPCGHFVENAIPLGKVFAADWICAACIQDGKSVKEAFEVCSQFLEDHDHDNMAEAVRALAEDGEEKGVYQDVIRSLKAGERDDSDTTTQHPPSAEPVTIEDLDEHIGIIVSSEDREEEAEGEIQPPADSD